MSFYLFICFYLYNGSEAENCKLFGDMNFYLLILFLFNGREAEDCQVTEVLFREGYVGLRGCVPWFFDKDGV